MKTTPRPWRSGFCGFSNPDASHARCRLTARGDLSCCCACHDPERVIEARLTAETFADQATFRWHQAALRYALDHPEHLPALLDEVEPGWRNRA